MLVACRKYGLVLKKQMEEVEELMTMMSMLRLMHDNKIEIDKVERSERLCICMLDVRQNDCRSYGGLPKLESNRCPGVPGLSSDSISLQKHVLRC